MGVNDAGSGSRVTAQRSQEDAEEVERERRRRSRERDRGEDSGPQDNRTDDTRSALTHTCTFCSVIHLYSVSLCHLYDQS